MKVFRLLLFMVFYWVSFLSIANDNIAVILYDGENLTGDSLAITGDTPSLGNLDQKMSSFELSPGYTIRFFLQENFEGGYYSANAKTVNSSSKLESLLELANNKVRSVKVLIYDESAPAAGYIYPEANFGGEKFEIKGDIASLKEFGQVGLGSFDIESGYEVRFYEGENFTGGYYSKNSSSVENADPSYGAEVKSLRIIMRNGEYIDGLDAAPVSTKPAVATLYEHHNWGGASFQITDDVAQLPSFIDQEMSSYKVAAGYEVRFFAQTNFRGDYWTRSSRDTDSRAFSGTNDAIRSVRIISTSNGGASSTNGGASSTVVPLVTDGSDVAKLDGSHVKDGWNYPYIYSQESGYTNKSWMSAIPDNINIASIAIPGTHQSGATHSVYAHQSLSVDWQLAMGIRYLDVRTKYSSGSGKLEVYAVTRSTPQYIDLDKIIQSVDFFLRTNPKETVIVRVQHMDYPTNLANWVARYNVVASSYSRRLIPSSDNPTLGEMRGKFVLINDHYGATNRFLLNRMSVQDHYNMGTNWSLWDRWEKVKAQFSNAGGSKISLNYLSGSGGSFPYFVASGKSSQGTGAPQLLTGKSGINTTVYPDFPRVACAGKWCSVAFAGTNQLTNTWIENGKFANLGVVVMDFPGPRLVNNIIQHNLKHLPTVKKYPPTSPAGNNFVIYSSINQKGMSKTITSSVSELTGVWNDRISSFYVPYGWVVRFYEHKNYQGRYWSRDGGKTSAGTKQNARDDRFDRIISSIQVIQKR